MSFRTDFAAEKGTEDALSSFVNLLPTKYREESAGKLRDIILQYGPVIDSYPCWHPLVAPFQDDRVEGTFPITQLVSGGEGYRSLDHTIKLVSGFISCPYSGADRLVESVHQIHANSPIPINAEILDTKFYQDTATSVLVTCKWPERESDHTISKRIAVGSMLEQALKGWRDTGVGETWETMRSYFLGYPHGSRSSLFVNQETGQAMKNVWNAILKARVFGPIYV